MINEEYYNKNAKAFFENTAKIDMQEIYEEFIKYLNTGDRILDIGCGSGRDVLFFANTGYLPIGIDCSDEMVKLASEFTGQKIIKLDVKELEYENEFEGVWACSSLLHLKNDEIKEVIKKIIKSLKNNGIIYMSFKYGNFEGIRNGRYFKDYQKDTLKELIAHFPALKIIKIWRTEDKRKDRDSAYWLNIILINHKKYTDNYSIT